MSLTITEARPEEFDRLGALLVEVYSALPGFPTPEQAPGYYRNLREIGALTQKPEVHLLVAHDASGELLGGVVYFGDMEHYGAGHWGSSLGNQAGFRFLGVSPRARGTGAGRALTEAYIELAKTQGKTGVILHTTEAMPVAWAMYERQGFQRATELDLSQGALPIFGFRLPL